MKTATKKTEYKPRNPRACARSLGEQLQALARTMNHTYTVAENVSPYTMAHWIDTKTGEQGIADLIARILRENGAVFPACIGDTSPSEKSPYTTTKAMALKASMTAREIIAEVQARFTAGTKRHSPASVYTYLCQWLSKPHSVKGKVIAPIIGKLYQSTSEDSERHCNKPQIVWFLIA